MRSTGTSRRSPTPLVMRRRTAPERSSRTSYKQLVGPVNDVLSKLGVLNATDPTNGQGQAKADAEAGTHFNQKITGWKKGPGGGYSPIYGSNIPGLKNVPKSMLPKLPKTHGT